MGDKESDDLELQTLLSENETKYKESSNPEKEGQAKDQGKIVPLKCHTRFNKTNFRKNWFVFSDAFSKVRVYK